MSKTQLRNRNIKLRTLEKVLYNEEDKEWEKGYVITYFNSHLDRKEFLRDVAPFSKVIVHIY